VIGDECFPVAIEPASPEAAVDFRRAQVFDLRHRAVQLPASLRDACVDLVRHLGLRFGAIDLVETYSGDYVFLEVNPNGQWLWLEWMTGLPLTAAIADLLGSANQRKAATKRTPRGRRRVTLSVGEHTIPRPPVGGEHHSGVDATRVWLERSRAGVTLHVGDAAAAESRPVLAWMCQRVSYRNTLTESPNPDPHTRMVEVRRPAAKAAPAFRNSRLQQSGAVIKVGECERLLSAWIGVSQRVAASQRSRRGGSHGSETCVVATRLRRLSPKAFP
jgi:hypothetical protein